MKIFRTLLLCLCLASGMSGCVASTNLGEKMVLGTDRELDGDDETVEDTLRMFLDANPYAVKVNILSEGTVAFICADEDNLFVRLSVGNPQLFMRMLMQGLTIYIDPTGRKKEKYALVFPSAADVQDSMNGLQPTRSLGAGDSEQDRPDIFPLLQEMNKVGVTYDVNGRKTLLGETRSYIELDTENETLNFYALVPKGQMMAEKKLSADWSVGLFLDTPSGNLEGPKGNFEMGNNAPSMGNENGNMPPQMQQGDSDMNKLMRKRIDVWSVFSIDEVNNVNLQ